MTVNFHWSLLFASSRSKGWNYWSILFPKYVNIVYWKSRCSQIDYFKGKTSHWLPLAQRSPLWSCWHQTCRCWCRGSRQCSLVYPCPHLLQSPEFGPNGKLWKKQRVPWGSFLASSRRPPLRCLFHRCTGQRREGCRWHCWCRLPPLCSSHSDCL